MASHTLTNCLVLHNELDLSGQANSVEATADADELDQTTFADAGYSNTRPGLKHGTFNYTGFLEYTSGMDGVLLSAFGGTNVSTIALDGTIGALAWQMKAANSSFAPLSGSVGQLAALTGSLKSSSGSYGLRAGKLLAPKAARTSTASTTGQQLFTTGTITVLTAALHITAASGTTPSVTVTVQSSATQGGSYTTRGTFTAATTATSEYIAVTGLSVTDQWWRATFTISGSSPSFTAAVSAAVS